MQTELFQAEDYRTGNEVGLEYISGQEPFAHMPKIPDFPLDSISNRAGRMKFEHELTQQQKETAGIIRGCLETGDLRRVIKRLGKESLTEFLQSLYPALSLNEIEGVTGIPDSTLGYWFRRLNISAKAWRARSISRLGQQNGFEVMETATTAAYLYTIQLTPDLAYLVGFAIGDGNTEKYSVATFNKDEEVIKHLSGICEKYGKITLRKRPDGLFRLRLSSGKIAELIAENGKLREDTIDKILDDEACSKYFIAAFWDAEGSVAAKVPGVCSSNVVLYNTNARLLEKIAKALARTGIETTATSYANFGREYFLKGRQVKQRKVMHKLRIREAHVKSWAEKIGVLMRHSKKSERVKQILQ